MQDVMARQVGIEETTEAEMLEITDLPVHMASTRTAGTASDPLNSTAKVLSSIKADSSKQQVATSRFNNNNNNNSFSNNSFNNSFSNNSFSNNSSSKTTAEKAVCRREAGIPGTINMGSLPFQEGNQHMVKWPTTHMQQLQPKQAAWHVEWEQQRMAGAQNLAVDRFRGS